MNPLPQEIWEALVKLQIACANQHWIFAGADLQTPAEYVHEDTKFHTNIGPFEIRVRSEER